MLIKTQVNESGSKEDLELFKFLNQFQDVFIDDIPGELPPKRGDDDHAIELIRGSSPPNKPPYRVSQAQQEEIMRQVNELVEKGMGLCPSVDLGVAQQESSELETMTCVDDRHDHALRSFIDTPLPMSDSLSHGTSCVDVIAREIDACEPCMALLIDTESVDELDFHEPNTDVLFYDASDMFEDDSVLQTSMYDHGEESDDFAKDLDGTEDYLSDRQEEEEEEEPNLFPRLVAVAVIQHALVIRRRLSFDPLGSASARGQVQPEKRFGVSHGKAAKKSSKEKKMSRSKKKKRSADSDLDTDLDSKIDTDSNSKTDFDGEEDSSDDLDLEEFLEASLATCGCNSKFVKGSGIWNSTGGMDFGIWTADLEVQRKESRRNGIGQKGQGVLISWGTYFKAKIALSAEVTHLRTNIFGLNLAWHAQIKVKIHHYKYKVVRSVGGHIQVWECRRSLSVKERKEKLFSTNIKGKLMVRMQDAASEMPHTRSMKMAKEELLKSRQQKEHVEVESEEAESMSDEESVETAVAAFDPNQEET
ncbi:hypothetical protein L7F22_061369 [Adiantum nelumboides]|nr:hypothetical protein [Adiantum nelumboides]